MRRSKQMRALGEFAILGAMCVLQLAGKPRMCEAYPAFRDEIPNGLRAGDQSSGMYATRRFVCVCVCTFVCVSACSCVHACLSTATSIPILTRSMMM